MCFFSISQLSLGCFYFYFIVSLQMFENGMEMGIELWESHGNRNKTQSWEWEWEGMGISCMGTGGNRIEKRHSRFSKLRPLPCLNIAYNR